MYCNQCGKVIADNAQFCNYCGNRTLKVKKSCPKCHNQYQPEIVFCGNCGTLLHATSAAGTQTNQIAAMPSMSCFFGPAPSLIAGESGMLAFYNVKMEMTTQGDVGRLRTNYKIIKQGQLNRCLCFPYSEIQSVNRGMHKKNPYFTLYMKNGETITFQVQSGSGLNPEMQMKLALSILNNHIDP